LPARSQGHPWQYPLVRPLVLSGVPKIKAKNVIGCEAVGLDIGPSTIAVVGDTDAYLLEFCPEVDKPSTKGSSFF